MIYKDEKLHNKYVINIIFDGASPSNYLQTTEMGSLMRYNLSATFIQITPFIFTVSITPITLLFTEMLFTIKRKLFSLLLLHHHV